MRSSELSGKVAVIAGASRGIGAEIGRLFAHCSARVILLAQDGENLRTVADGINRDGGEAIAFSMDVSVSQKWNELSALIRSRKWSWDILVNNAYWRTQTPIGEVSDEDWDRTLAVSLKAYFLGARAAIPFMLRDGGTIVNISSLQSHIPEPGFGAYAVAKGGVDSLSRVIARDYSPKVRANTLIPGAVDTPGFAESDEVKKQLGQRLPAGRIGLSGELAQAALFLAGPRSSFMTGAEMIVDGGRSIT